MNSKQVGDISVAQIVARLIKAGKQVLAPYLSDNQRYDIVVDEDGKFERIQCKTGRLKDGVISFPTASTYAHRGGKRKHYAGQIEKFAVYCPENDEVYVVPIDKINTKSSYTLRIDEPKSKQKYSINWAKDFKL